LRRQCALFGLTRSGIYRQPTAPQAGKLARMRWIGLQYLATPFYGSRRMTAALRHAGYLVKRKRVQPLMRVMELAALGPSRRSAAWRHSIGSTLTRCAG
jgi:putative transposase